ncbi:MAG TPA: YggS family pyridoxal phosphate enzyme [Solirubrobacteraceae bacterium]|nr:YggS family pyridoxal phosphate enzyme [Solirubrobacteraceae bacterium]
MAELITGLRAERLRENLERVREGIGAFRDPGEVQVLAAVKYVAAEELPVLAEAGIELVGENRAQELAAKADAHPGMFTWDFIGHLQSRKVKQILPYVRWVHSVASDSALEQLGKHGGAQTEVLIEVNVAGEAGKSGISPNDLPRFLERAPVRVVGLMTMPPLAEDPEASRPHFAALRELAVRHGLHELSMGTSQDYTVAVQEGATIVRLGSVLYR